MLSSLSFFDIYILLILAGKVTFFFRYNEIHPSLTTVPLILNPLRQK